MTTRLARLYHEFGQSPWLDSLSRGALLDGSLERHIDRGIRGITTNPAIFDAAFGSSDLYDDDIRRLALDGKDAEAIAWDLMCRDVVEAADRLRALHDESGGDDGWVSIEVSPLLADDAAGSLAAACHLQRLIQRPNVMIKIPATRAGLVAIEECAAAGISVNATLIFGLDRYRAVRRAWWAGLRRLSEAGPELLPRLRSVASFFVSRVDAIVDPLLPPGSRLLATAAVTQALLAHADCEDDHRSPMWNEIARLGAARQRLLWASTATKNPLMVPTKYVDELIRRDTVTTLPSTTIEAVEASRLPMVDRAEPGYDPVGIWRELEASGVDMTSVADRLEAEGVHAFRTSHARLLDTISTKLETALR